MRRPRWYDWLSIDLGVFLAVLFAPLDNAPLWIVVPCIVLFFATALPLMLFVLCLVMMGID